MRLKNHLIIILSTLNIFGCAPKTADSYDSKKGYSGNISISGAFALYPIVVLWAEDFKKINPHVRFNISAGGAGKGITDVVTDMVDIGLVSRDLNPQEMNKGLLPITVARDAVLGTYNPNNPNAKLLQERGLSQKELKGIFIDKTIQRWSDIDKRFSSDPMTVYTRSDAAGAAETWAKFFGCYQEDLQGVGIFGDPNLAQAVKDNPLAIGFNNVNFVYDLQTKKTSEHIAVIPIDINANGKLEEEEQFYQDLPTLTNAIANHRYPAPPSRDLMLVLRTANDRKLIKEFVAFTLKPAQQKLLLANGYIPLTESQRNEALKKLAR